MKKVININFQGAVVPIEETSYELLKQYTESLRQYFANEDGRDEIINDIESRISELFQERLKKGSTCITDDDVNAIIKNMGRPQDLEDAEGGEQEATKEKTTNQKEESTFQDSWNWKGPGKRLYRDENHKVLGGVCSGIAAYFGIDPVIVRVLFIVSGIGFLLYLLLWIFVPGSNMLVNGVRKRLYRNPDGKIIGGVCSGMGSYFNVNPWLPRIIFLIPFISFFFRWGHVGPLTFPNFLSFSFSPGTFIIYIILWLVIPEATTTSEKLEMKGEKVDLTSIKNSVVEEMKGVKERVNKLGMEAGNIAKEKGSEIGKEMQYAAKRTSGALGNIIVTLFKIFAYFVLGCIALALIIALFSIAVVSIGLFPLKAFVLTDGWQSVLAWGTLIFFIGVPVVGVITFIIRRIAKIKSTNRMMRFSFLGLWILGIICFVSLIASVGNDFRRSSSITEEKIALTNPGVQSLEVTSFNNNRYYRSDSWFRFEPFANFDDDTVFIGNVRIRIEKSPTDSFEVGLIKMCSGDTRRDADTLAALINFNISQSDSILFSDRAISINTKDKFRNQSVEVIVYVPVGHRIKINKNMSYNRIRINGPWWNNNDWYDWENNDDYDYKYDETYIMKEDGLYTLDGIPANKESDYRRDWNSDYDEDQNPGTLPNDQNYRYNQHDKIDSLSNAKKLQIEKIQASLDSLKKEKEKEDTRLKDSLNNAKEKLEQKIEKLDAKTGASAYIRIDKPSYNFVMHI
ncbi:PspC domain-containing protein [Ginsengibacter hankyongi]|uniref:PspC domain-containing protein n=1 Tax=Ginsengibacter hankyongi TaxID=2607284 RepID=A0A5J5IQX8_9BACT|nr:PspC domain-containing protein [Ginsengibacter hankyongi]KAA9041962.1 PspC domain-containing protein [Ginsengibacter hankyongi]